MKAIRVHQFGGPEECRLDEMETTLPGPGEVAVAVRAASVNFRDLLVLKGVYDPKIKRPYVPASDGAGVVAEVGMGVKRWKVGDRVVAAFMPAWLSGPQTDATSAGALGGGGAGMLAERVILHESGLVAIPQHLSFEEAATLPCAAVTAWHALVEKGRLKAGETVLVQGTGGVSLFALQIARASGATVIATTGSESKVERLLELGASHVINYKSHENWDANVRDLTGGAGVDHVVEVGGAATLSKSLRSVKTAGRLSVIGVLSGGVSDVNILPILMKGIHVQGIYVGSVAMFEALNRAIALHSLRPIVDKVFPIEETAEALRHMESGRHFGKIVIRL